MQFKYIFLQNFIARNPTKGQIINKPNGPDVYKNVLKDYTKKVFI